MSNQNFNNSKRVFILGAGSSISHDSSFPSISDFFSKAIEHEIDIRKEFPELYEYIFRNFGLSVATKNTKVNIETIFTYLEIDLERSQDTLLAIIRHQLLKLIQSLLSKLTDKNKKENGDLYKFAKTLSANDSIITFNWDIILDNYLGRESIIEWIYAQDNKSLIQNCYYNYIFYLSDYLEDTFDGIGPKPPYSEWSNAIGYLLKMHGSIDWVFCNNNLCRNFGKGYIIPDFRQQYYCYICHEPTQLLLIPPVLNKQYRTYHLIRRIWNTALKEIETANEIIIWGYSLPETDFYSAWLLRNARQNIETLTLINPSVVRWSATKKVKKINKAFVKHFAYLFKGNFKKDSIILYETFEDFQNGLTVDKKYEIKS